MIRFGSTFDVGTVFDTALFRSSPKAGLIWIGIDRNISLWGS
jgi:hypothetical protein